MIEIKKKREERERKEEEKKKSNSMKLKTENVIEKFHTKWQVLKEIKKKTEYVNDIEGTDKTFSRVG